MAAAGLPGSADGAGDDPGGGHVLLAGGEGGIVPARRCQHPADWRREGDSGTLCRN